MNVRFVLLAAALVLLLVLLSTAARDNTVAAEPTSPGFTDIAMQGTMWQPEIRKGFNLFRPYAWGVLTRRKPTAYQDQWVHIGVPLLTYLEDRPQKVKYVEFCAKSSNGAVTKPIWMDVYDNAVSIGQYAVTWAANNNYQCFGHDFGGAAAWRSTLGISVMLRFANASDTITLYKAWASVID